MLFDALPSENTLSVIPKQVMLMFDDHTFDDEMLDPQLMKGMQPSRTSNTLTTELLS